MPDREPLPRTSALSMAALQLSLHWRCDNARHHERVFAPKLNLRRDILPPELEAELIDQPIGHRARHSFAAGGLAPRYEQRDCLTLRTDGFNSRHRAGTRIEPAAGRFYPKGLIAGVRGILPQDGSPFRIGEVGDRLTADLNHPLAGRELDFGADVVDAWAAGDEHGGRCNDIAGLVTQNGAGMQARWHNRPTDFFGDMPFLRDAPQPDSDFYQRPRLVDHLDRTATAQVEDLYRRLIEPGAEVLDLMSSWKSHLSDDLPLVGVAGLGMNREELDANPRLSDRTVRDLNLSPTLPYADDRFDAAVCTVSVEYLTKPFELFAEVRRVLRPGGKFIVSFSNRWFPPKVIRIWRDLHEFERPGLVLEYFLRTGGFADLETQSVRGLPRPDDDKYADRLVDSDPVYAVWGTVAKV